MLEQTNWYFSWKEYTVHLLFLVISKWQKSEDNVLWWYIFVFLVCSISTEWYTGTTIEQDNKSCRVIHTVIRTSIHWYLYYPCLLNWWYLYTRNTHVIYYYNGNEVVSCPFILLSLVDTTNKIGEVTNKLLWLLPRNHSSAMSTLWTIRKYFMIYSYLKMYSYFINY